MTTLATLALAVLALAVIWVLFLEERICNQVRNSVPDVWRQLGSPERYFDAGGQARRAALAHLAEDRSLLEQCPDDVARQVRFASRYGRVSLILGLIAWVGSLVCFLCLAMNRG